MHLLKHAPPSASPTLQTQICGSTFSMRTCSSTPRLGRRSRGSPPPDLRLRSITCRSRGTAALACCLSSCCLWRRLARVWRSWCTRRLASALPPATRAWSRWRASPVEAWYGACAHVQLGQQALTWAAHHGAGFVCRPSSWAGASWGRRLPPPPSLPQQQHTGCQEAMLG